MSPLRVRQGGQWVDTAEAGMVRYGEQWVPFGPPAAGFEALPWPDPPAVTNGDDAAVYNMGAAFTLLADRPCHGVRWRAPDVTPDIGTAYAVAIWGSSGQGRVALATFVPVPGVAQNVLFGSPVALTTGVVWIASVLTRHYTYTAAPAGDVVSASGNVVASPVYGRLAVAGEGADTFPANGQNAIYHVSPLIGV